MAKSVTINAVAVSDPVAAPVLGEYVLDVTVPDANTSTYNILSRSQGGSWRAEREDNGSGAAYVYSESVSLLVPGNREYAIEVLTHTGTAITVSIDRSK